MCCLLLVGCSLCWLWLVVGSLLVAVDGWVFMMFYCICVVALVVWYCMPIVDGCMLTVVVLLSFC